MFGKYIKKGDIYKYEETKNNIECKYIEKALLPQQY